VLSRVCLFAGALVLASVSWSLAASGWKEEQAKRLEQAGLKPGQTIDAASWEKVKTLIPEQMVEWVKKGDMLIKIGELKYDCDTDDEWKAASSKNEGKYDLDEGLELRDKSTGKNPLYIYGEPFPNIDWKKDPNAGIKMMHNLVVARHRPGSMQQSFSITWVNRQGAERDIYVDYNQYFYYSRQDGEQKNPKQFLEYGMPVIKSPNDIAGMITLTKRFIDKRPDDFFAYVPSIRRVKRLSGANRSDPFAGSDFDNDSQSGWQGKNTSMTWKVLEKKVALLPMGDKTVERWIPTTKRADGAWVVHHEGQEVLAGFEVPGSKGAPWFPANALWVMREIYVLEATPVDPYYGYGKQIYYFDPAIGLVHKIIYDKAGEYWKGFFNILMPVQWGDPVVHQTFASSSFYFTYDEKTNHGCSAWFFGTHAGKDFKMVYADPTIVPKDFSEDLLSTMSR
jgi:hypothetical protein